ncbi:MAG: hypothetical protein L0332_15065 [Chloroflexi bacterium]|nr:hypothetical protein [Chloroflexota bacterium]MCI0579279.1 hypothetical protein [Chloroflexota bacterium]MCI0644361.1 hypothetical protein [Chloroflexota bacterium]MCI0728022.1 hypothetical protein [Chloroflexota bacterium]
MTQPFDLIWTQLPERQGRYSSTWWFFLLAPRQAEGYGPKQMMFTLASRVGGPIVMSGVKQAGLDRRRPAGGEEEQFNTMAVGWIHDGERTHERIVNQPVVATLSKKGFLAGWAGAAGGQRWGAELKAAADLPSGINAHFAGQKGYARFEVWADDSARLTTPGETLDLQTPLGGAHVVGWQQLSFRGEFGYPGNQEQLEGIGYFQRVCLNFPAFPWKWIWVAFEDKSIFSCFIPYLGLNLFRRGEWFFPGFLETTTIPIKPNGYFAWGDSLEMVRFNKVRVTPTTWTNGCPAFAVECRSSAGDFIRYRIEPYGHAQLTLDRPLLRGLWRSTFNYNEYMFRVRELSGNVGGRPLGTSRPGNGFGNIEYTWGMGL